MYSVSGLSVTVTTYLRKAAYNEESDSVGWFYCLGPVTRALSHHRAHKEEEAAYLMPEMKMKMES